MTGPPGKRRGARLAGDGPAPLKSAALGNGDRAQDTARDPFTQPDPLLAECLATPDLNSRQRRQLEELGVTREARHRCGGLGWSRVSITGRLYIPSDAGDVAIIMPVWAGAAPSIYQAVEDPLLDDLIAWHPDNPTRWLYRLGTSGAVLGADNLDLAHSEGWPICFALTPLQWLRGDCRGSVLLELCEEHWRSLDEAEQDAHGAAWWRGRAA